LDKILEAGKPSESGSERNHLRLLPGKQAKVEHYRSLWIEDSPQFAAESFNRERHMVCIE
jgi:hypothetical protein